MRLTGPSLASPPVALASAGVATFISLESGEGEEKGDVKG